MNEKLTFKNVNKLLNLPALLALLVFASGIVNIYSVFYSMHSTRARLLHEILPLQISLASRTLILVSGLFLIFLADGLRKKKWRAWFLSCLVLGLSLIFHTFKSLDIEEIVELAVPLFLLLSYRKEFRIHSSRRSLAVRVKQASGIGIMLLLYATAGYFLLQGQFSHFVTWNTISQDYLYSIFNFGYETLKPITHRAVWFEESISAVSIIVLVWILAVLFGPDTSLDSPTSEAEQNATFLLSQYSRHPLSYLGLMEDKLLYFYKDKCFISYKLAGTVAVMLAEPTGEAVYFEQAFIEFHQTQKQRGLTTVVYMASDEFKKILEKINFKFLKLGDDAWIDLNKFTLQTPELKSVRNSLAHIQREEVNFEWYSMGEIPYLVEKEITKLYDQWRLSKNNSSMTFSLNFFPFPELIEGRLLLAKTNTGELVGIFSFFPFLNGQGMALDLMIRGPQSPNGIVEASFAVALEKFKIQNFKYVSLGLATLTENSPTSQQPLAQHALDFMYKRFNQFYKYTTLTRFKKKFTPVWQPRYLAYSSDAELPKIAYAITSVHFNR